MNERHQKPDDLGRQVSIGEEEQQTKGKLKIFFGYAAGVGKTYAMLEAAHAAKKQGMDVVAGYIEPHTRPETLELLEGLELVVPLSLPYKNIRLPEFDLDGAIVRAPQLILVDELAHTNGEGCRHKKRYQDIEELLKAGINVYTTVNVQHIESLNDIVAAITGIIVKERIPDSIFDDADQVELVDIEPDDLIDRLHKGKIYKQQQAATALNHFFIKENLVALREIALRRTADRVNKIVAHNKTLLQKGTYFTAEHILTCISDSPCNAKVIRTAARMADAFHGSFTALYVESASLPLDREGEKRLAENIKLAEQLGARIASIDGEDAPYHIAEYAKTSGVSKIVLGRSSTRRRGFYPKANFAERLTELAPDMDIYIIPDLQSKRTPKRVLEKGNFGLSLADALKAIAVLAAATMIGFWFYSLGFSEANIITVYILGVLIISMITDGKLCSILASVLSVLVFNFYFTIPRFSFQAYDRGYPVTFLVMFLAAFLSSTLTMRVKTQMKQSSRKAYRTQILLETSQKLQRADSREAIINETAVQLRRLLARTVLFYTPQGKDLGEPVVFSEEGESTQAYVQSDEKAVAQWVYKNSKHAGATTNTLPGAKCLYLAVRSYNTVFAVVGVAMTNQTPMEAFEKSLMISMLGECALALEKEQISRTKREVELKAQQESLRANLLRAISHDLRTPLTSISGNAGVLMENSSVLGEEKKQQLYTDIYDDSLWLINLVENLLSITRIDNGAVELNLEPELLEDVIAEALRHISRKKKDYLLSVHVEDDLLMARMDPRLIIQVLINIVENALKYTKPGSSIAISAKRQGSQVLVEIADDGEGVDDASRAKLFDMFYTAGSVVGDSRRGLGLGLALCKSIVEAHGGTLHVRENKPHGTVFYFTLQAEEVPYDE